MTIELKEIDGAGQFRLAWGPDEGTVKFMISE